MSTKIAEVQHHHKCPSMLLRCKTDSLAPYMLQQRSKVTAASQAQRHLQHSCHTRCEELAMSIKGLQQELQQQYASHLLVQPDACY